MFNQLINKYNEVINNNYKYYDDELNQYNIILKDINVNINTLNIIKKKILQDINELITNINNQNIKNINLQNELKKILDDLTEMNKIKKIFEEQKIKIEKQILEYQNKNNNYINNNNILNNEIINELKVIQNNKIKNNNVFNNLFLIIDKIVNTKNENLIEYGINYLIYDLYHTQNILNNNNNEKFNIQFLDKLNEPEINYLKIHDNNIGILAKNYTDTIDNYFIQYNNLFENNNNNLNFNDILNLK